MIIHIANYISKQLWSSFSFLVWILSHECHLDFFKVRWKNCYKKRLNVINQVRQFMLIVKAFNCNLTTCYYKKDKKANKDIWLLLQSIEVEINSLLSEVNLPFFRPITGDQKWMTKERP